jgi:hypothetical protein
MGRNLKMWDYVEIGSRDNVEYIIVFKKVVLDWLTSYNCLIDYKYNLHTGKQDGPGHISLCLPDDLVSLFLMRFEFQLCDCNQ